MKPVQDEETKGTHVSAPVAEVMIGTEKKPDYVIVARRGQMALGVKVVHVKEIGRLVISIRAACDPGQPSVAFTVDDYRSTWPTVPFQKANEVRASGQLVMKTAVPSHDLSAVAEQMCGQLEEFLHAFRFAIYNDDVVYTELERVIELSDKIFRRSLGLLPPEENAQTEAFVAWVPSEEEKKLMN